MIDGHGVTDEHGATDGRRRWWVRAASAVPVYGVAMAVGLALHDDPDPVTMALVVGLLVAIGALLIDGSRTTATPWRMVAPSRVGLGRSDPRTAAHLRLIEGHLTAEPTGPALRERLRAVADQTLRARHELEVDDPRAEPLLGPELIAVISLDRPPRRLSVAELDRHLRRIEDL